MAVVKAPALSLDASGNLGGICYSRWRGLNLARDTWTGTYDYTIKRLLAQSTLNQVAQEWSGGLTEEEREEWRKAAQSEVRMSKVKTKYVPSGYQYFMEINIQRYRRDFGTLRLPPPADKVNGMVSITGYWNKILSKLNVKGDPLRVEDDTNYRWEGGIAGPYNGQGRMALEGEFRFFAFCQFYTYYGILGLTLDKYYWIRMRFSFPSGRMGNWFTRQFFTQT